MSERRQKALRRYGLNLGMAFQLADDRLDYMADGNRLGKTLGQDLKQGMVTLPLLHLLQTCSETEKQWISTQIRAKTLTDQDLTYVLDLMENYGSLAYAKSRAREYVEAASLDLEPFTNGTAKRSLSVVASYMINRDQ